MSHHPIFNDTLRAFGGAAYSNVEALTKRCTIRVDRLEATVHPKGLDPRDVYFDRTGYLTDDQNQRAYEILAARHMDELDAIANQLASGELA